MRSEILAYRGLKAVTESPLVLFDASLWDVGSGAIASESPFHSQRSLGCGEAITSRIAVGDETPLDLETIGSRREKSFIQRVQLLGDF